MTTTAKIIEGMLKKTLDCQYKRAFTPRGWVCVNVKKFSNELAKKLKEVAMPAGKRRAVCLKTGKKPNFPRRGKNRK